MFKHALLAAFAVALALPAAAQGSPTATHTVNVTVPTVRVLTLTGGDVTLSAEPVAAGDADLSFTGTSAYNMLTNGTNDKITATIDGGTGLAAGLTLSGTYGAPAGASGGTDVALTGAIADVVTGLANQSASGQSIAYTATAGLSVVPDDYTFDLLYTIQAN